MTVPDRVVFDTEPLVAHADDEPGSTVVEEYLDAVVVEHTDGYINRVNVNDPTLLRSPAGGSLVEGGALTWTPVLATRGWHGEARLPVEGAFGALRAFGPHR